MCVVRLFARIQCTVLVVSRVFASGNPFYAFLMISTLYIAAFHWKFVAFFIQPRDIHYPARSLKPGQRGGDLIDSY